MTIFHQAVTEVRKFNQTAVDYLGYIVTPDGIKPKQYYEPNVCVQVETIYFIIEILNQLIILIIKKKYHENQSISS